MILPISLLLPATNTWPSLETKAIIFLLQDADSINGLFPDSNCGCFGVNDTSLEP